MLQLAMEAISTFKASRKRSCKESSHHASTKKLAPHHPISSKIDSTDLEPSHFMDPKDDTKKADFVHPLMREMLFPRRDVPDYSLLPLPFPPTKALQTTPEVDYFEEGSSSGDEYDPDDLAGEAAYKCEMCLLVFDEQADADAHMASDRHRNALNLMMLTAVNYATDIDVIVKLRRKMLGMGKVAVAADRARRKNPSSATTMEVAEYESELERLEKECTERGLSGLQELDTAVGNEVQMVHASTDKTADETTRRKGLRKRRPHRKTKVPVGVVV
ncbi:hypothetical protein BV898_04925 [Hypsibius exemplaris]|nr:hypothetical protein BV898_04925 [Hypsibius exemplaris]